MNLTPENIKQFTVIEGDRDDDRVIVSELTGEYDGVLVLDNAGWSIVLDVPFKKVVRAFKKGYAGGEFDLSSTTVKGITFANDYSKGWILAVPADD